MLNWVVALGLTMIFVGGCLIAAVAREQLRLTVRIWRPDEQRWGHAPPPGTWWWSYGGSGLTTVITGVYHRRDDGMIVHLGWPDAGAPLASSIQPSALDRVEGVRP